MSRRLLAVTAGAAVLAAAVVMLRSGVQPPPQPVTGPDGQRIGAYHDAALVTPPQRPGERPHPPGRLHTDPRRGGALVSWPSAPYSFDVRWSPARNPDDVRRRQVAAPAVSLDGLAPGRWHVEVRSVDEVGARSEPMATDVDVSDAVPPWQQGLGFVEDFTAGAGLDPDRWRLSDSARQCVRREGDPGPILLDGRCNGGALTPVSPLQLTGAGGTLGRVVVVAEAPPPPQATPWGFDQPPDMAAANYLTLTITPDTDPPQPLGYATAPVQLWIGSGGAFLAVTAPGQFPGPQWPPGARLDVPQPAGLGAPHRWELVFTANEVIVLLDGGRVGAAPYRPAWLRAQVQLTAYVSSDGAVPPAARVAFVGQTGPQPDGRPVRVVDLSSPVVDGGVEQALRLPAVTNAQDARLSVLIAGYEPDLNPGNSTGPPPAPDVRADAGGRPLELARRPSPYPGDPTTWLSGDVPLDMLAAGAAVTLRSVGGGHFVAFNAELEIRYRPGRPIDAQEPLVEPPSDTTLPGPRLRIRKDGRIVAADSAPRGVLEVEVTVTDAAAAAAHDLAGWVALRVELDGRRILDFPTATDGPATVGTYQFTLDTTDLSDGYFPLVVTLIPERAGLRPTTDRTTVHLGG